ncbi:Glucose-6-phosphate isomerase [Planctomycetales bacterium 10988]|nr:Glucose-6-phosphate isomerase [Planctomycetales bacterium 10988]
MASSETAQPAIAPLRYDPSGVMIEKTGLSPSDLEALAPQLEAARSEVLADLELWHSGKEVPAEKEPLDAGFTDLPDRLLKAYEEEGDESELGQIIAAAKRISSKVDRVVSLGIGGSYMGARALMEACCHPYYNELSRKARGGHPRIYFEGNNVDNDATQGLFDLLGREGTADSVEDQWGIVVISKSGGTLETAVAFRQFLSLLWQSCGRDGDCVAELVVPVTGEGGKLHQLVTELGCPDTFFIPDGVGGRFSIFTAVGLLPAALMGIDIVKLLQGARFMNQLFQTKSPGENPVLDYVGVCHAMEKKHGADIRLLSTWGKGLEAAGMWYDQLLSESLGKEEQGAMPLTVVNTRDLHSRGQQHQEGKRDKLITNVIVEQWKRDRLAVGHSDYNQDQLNDLAAKTLPEIMTAAIQGTNTAYHEDGRPTADLIMPILDEATMGQYFQMMMLATVVEGRLIDINPYGQPGVEAYKKHMKSNLSS